MTDIYTNYEDSAQAAELYSKSIESISFGSSSCDSNPYSDKESMRGYFGQPQYDYHRPDKAMPTKHRDIVIACQLVYKECGLIRNIIDLISDFCIQGMRIVHPNEKTEIFYKNWFSRVNGLDRSERFCSSLFKNGSAVMRRRNAQLSIADKKKIYSAVAGEDVQPDHVKARRSYLPYEYTFLNPATIELVGGSAAVFVNKKEYCIQIPAGFNSYWCGGKEEIRQILKELPPDIQNAVQNGGQIKLDSKNLIVYHYKKDDWEEWPTPIIFSILKDIRILDQMKLADLSALEGAIENIIVFKLGSLDHKLMPGDGAFAKLSSILSANTGAGRKVVVWGPDLEILESKSEIYKFLGDDKYKPHLNAIYAGVGIPPTLTGTDSSNGTTNNLISLKTLIRRLEYARSLLIDFWSKEIEMVRQAMNFPFAATIEFDNNNLGEEEAEKKLWIELAERNIISDEAVIKKFGGDPRMETSRLIKESKQRSKRKRLPKAGPYHNPQLEDNAKISLIEKGLVNPKEFNTDIEDVVVEPPKPEKMPEKSGRPKNSKDLSPRKKRVVNPVSKAGLRIWAEQVQAQITEVMTPIFLDHFNKKNMRSLSSKEAALAEDVKFGVLLNVEPLCNIPNEHIIATAGALIPETIYSKYHNYLDNTKKIINRDLSLNDIRKVQIELYLEEKINDN